MEHGAFRNAHRFITFSIKMSVCQEFDQIMSVPDPHEDTGKPQPGFILKRNGMISA